LLANWYETDRRAERLVPAQVPVYLYCCNRLLGESIARTLTKVADFRVAVPVFAGAQTPSQPLPGSVVILDSLQVLERHQSAQQDSREIDPYYPLLVSMGADSAQFLRAIRRGVRGYVLRDASARDLVAAVRAISAGEAVCPPGLTSALFDGVSSQSARRSRNGQRLTRREEELIPLIGRGLTNKEIAAQLHLSEETIKSHVHRILRKVGVDDRRSAAEACQPSCCAGD
jgi:DNA-binding NarL/FixJ family response regulator